MSHIKVHRNRRTLAVDIRMRHREDPRSHPGGRFSATAAGLDRSTEERRTSGPLQQNRNYNVTVKQTAVYLDTPAWMTSKLTATSSATFRARSTHSCTAEGRERQRVKTHHEITAGLRATRHIVPKGHQNTDPKTEALNDIIHLCG